MTKKRSTKRALLLSFLSLLMCVSMLIGSTYAWFTDSVTSANNIIKSGTLDVTMEWKDATATGKQQTYKDASEGAIFNYDKWEPGYVEAKNVKIANVGTLALKYQLNIAANGIVSELANVIDVYYADGEYKLTNRSMTELKNIGTLAEVLANLNSTASGTLEAGKGDTVTIALKMRETAGNEYQGKSIGSDFTVQLLATQLTSESDSFDNQYDANAAFSIWNGVVPAEMPETLVVDGAKQTVYVKDAAAFAYLSTLSAKWADLYTDGQGRTYTNYANGAGANYYYSGKWTVSLEADIDLDNKAIEPTVIVFGETTGASAFEGNGHTIRNINTTTGLFADNARATFSNLTLINVKATNGALIGSANTKISNITVKNAIISGTDYVGGVVGYCYGAINNCKVIDSSVVASGKEAGGLVGYVVTSTEETTVASNLVRNVSVYANNRAAGLAAQVNLKVKVYNNVIENVTVGAVDTTTYQPGAVVSNALDAANIYGNTVTNATVVTNEIAISKNDNDISDALATGKDVVFSGDVDAQDSNSNGYGTTGLKVSGSTVDGAGNTLSVPGANGTWDSAVSISGGTLKNITIDAGFRGVFVTTGTEKVFLENVVIDGPTYTISCDQASKQGLEATNSTFNGWTSYAGTIGNVKFVDCSFGEGAGYAFCRPYAPTEFVNCDFEAGYRLDARAAVTFENCTIGGVALTAENLATLVTSNIANASVK